MDRKRVWIGVAFIAVISAGFTCAEDCGEERATECKEKLLDILFGDFTEEETCDQLYGVSKCLRKVVDDCLGDEDNSEVEESLKEFNDLLDGSCQEQTQEADKDEEDDDVKKCLDENQDYLLNCIIDYDTGDISQLLQPASVPSSIDPQFVQCYLYGVMAHCVVSRSEEKCGVAGGNRAEELLSDLPPSVQESCDSQQDKEDDSLQELFSVHLLDQRKKRQVEYRKKRRAQYMIPEFNF